MAKTAKAKKPAKSQKLAGKIVCFTGALRADKESLAAIIAEEGGRIVESVSESLDYLVRGEFASKTSAAEKKAQSLIQKKGAPIQILDEADFHQLLAPTRDEAIALLKSGPAGHKAWNRLCGQTWFLGKIDLSGTDFRKIKIAGGELAGESAINLQSAIVDRCDFSGACLQGVKFGNVADAKFDGTTGCVQLQMARRCSFSKAALPGSMLTAEDCVLDDADLSSTSKWSGSVWGLVRCQARRINLSKTRLNPADFSQADLTGAKLPEVLGAYTQAKGTCFAKASLAKADLENSNFKGADFSGADLAGTDLKSCDFSGANLRQALLAQADLAGATLAGADLTKADLRNAWLSGADLTGAILRGADFSEADVAGAKITAEQAKTARGLDMNSVKPLAAGPAVRELEQILAATDGFDGTIRVLLESGDHVQLGLQSSSGRWGSHVHGRTTYYPASGGSSSRDDPTVTSVSGCLLRQGRRWRQGVPQFDSVEINATKSPLKPKELRTLALKAWCEALTGAAPSDEEIEQRLAEKADEQGTVRDALLTLLRAGQSGVAELNQQVDALDYRARAGILKFRGSDLSGLDLAGVHLPGADLENANLSRTDLQKAQFGQKANLKGANLERVDGRGAGWHQARFQKANLAGAKLSKADLRCCTFRDAELKGADFTGADLGYADLKGADFSAAKLKDVALRDTVFDEQTKFPSGFGFPGGLVWKGDGADPRLTQKIESLKQTAESIDFDTFMQRMGENVEAERLKKALSMLKAERFQLFAVVDGDAVTGVVKSQSDPNLVYSCRLDAGGKYACCTQNLNVCGGLRGALCKHLLVLLIGLTKGGDLEPGAADVWIGASRLQKPALDKDRMSEIFLKYKGAEAGQIDWRPTETVPEDFYAF